MADHGGALGLRPDHEPGRVDNETSGRPKASQSWKKRAALSEGVGVDRAAEVLGSFAIRPNGGPRCGQRVEQGSPEARAQLEHGFDVGDQLDQRGLVDARRVLGEGPAQRRWSARPSGSLPESREVPLAMAIASGSSAARASITPFEPPSGARPPRARRASPPASIITGPPIPMFASGVAMITSQLPSSAEFPAKHRPETIPIRGTRPLRRAKLRKVGPRGERARTGPCRRAPAAAFGEEHHRQPHAPRRAGSCGRTCVVADAWVPAKTV